MAKLSVNNQVFNYKGTEYNIANIAKVETSTRQVKTTSTKIPFSPVFVRVVIAIVIGAASVSMSNVTENSLFLAGLIGTLGFAIAAKRSWRKWWNYVPNGGTMHMLTITLNYGKKETFESSNSSTITKIKSAISDAMNKKSNVSFSMSDVNVTISESPNAKIGVFE